MSDVSLVDLIPLWRTLRHQETTVLVTPALDYVGAFEVIPLDARFASGDAVDATGERLRSLIGSLDDDCTLHFLYRVALDGEGAIADYVSAHSAAEPALREFVEGRATWLRGQPLRQVRVFLFFSPKTTNVLQRGALGVRLPFASVSRAAQEQHDSRVKAVSRLRDRLATQLSQVDLLTRELGIEEVQQLHFQLLNPSHSVKRWAAPKVTVRDTLWADEFVAEEGEHLREYTEAEQLVLEGMQEERGHLRQEGVFRRVTTLKLLPEGGTPYFAAEPLLQLLDDAKQPFSYWLSVSISVHSQGRSRFRLNAQHGLVEALTNAIPFLADKSVARQAADSAKQNSIAALFAELNAMSTKLVSLSVSLLLDAPSLEELDSRTEAARSAFREIGNSELLLEEVSQLPAFLSMLPGAGAYQLRKKTCTSRNAGDFLPVLGPWKGSAKAVALYTSPMGDIFRFDPFDSTLGMSHHGLVVASTGSGKSVALGAMTLDALASGIDAILIDNGRSWEAMTKLCGGKHLVVDIKTPLAPFRCWSEMVDESGRMDAENIQDVVAFLEMCVREEGERGFDKVTVQLVARAVSRVYEEGFRKKPEERPLMSAFRNGIDAEATRATHVDDKRICENLYRRLGLFVGDELYGTFLDRPSELRFDARLITFEMSGVSKSPITKSIAMATIMAAITARAARRNRRTLVEVDEGHAYLGDDDTSERFLGRCYRVMRKYSVAMWMITQQFVDFVKSKQGDAIIGNSTLKLFLRHGSGHDFVENYFGMSARARSVFEGLSMRAGHYSDMLLMYGDRMTSLRLGLDPFAYWLLTTDGNDKALLHRAAAKNPKLSQLELIRQVARLYPRGAPKGTELNAA